LAEDDPDPPSERDPLARRLESGDRDPARARYEDPGEHLHRRRLAGAVRADVPEHRPRLDREADVVDRADDATLAAEATALDAHAERLLDVLEGDDAQG
jgi:hypothetical protein